MTTRGKIFATASMLLGGALLAAACNSDDGEGATSGGVVVVVETDMAVPQDLDRVDVLVTRGGSTLYQKQADLGPGKTGLPTTFEVFADRANGAPITIKTVGRQAGRARIVRDAITPVPANGLSAVHIALGWLCDNTAVESSPGQVYSTCPNGNTCIEGTCSSPQVNDAGPYEPGAAPSPDKCFDAQACFGANAIEVPLADDCTVPTPAGSQLNFALKQTPSGLLAVLHADGSGGWSPSSGGRIKLPSSVCAARAQGKSFVVLASTSCPTKLSTQAQCSARPSPAAPPPSDVGSACSGAAQESCGNCGTRTRTCSSNGVWSEWGACTGGGECSPGASEACGASGTRSCGGTCKFGACDGQKCDDGASTQACGNCGTQTRTCNNGTWSDWGACSDQGECAPNAHENCAGGHRTCSGMCKWSTCEAYTCAGPSTQSCGDCGTQRRTCDAASGQWSAWGACEQPTDHCAPGTNRACGSGGTQSCGGTCQYGSCGGQQCVGALGGNVANGASESESCGNCGTRSRVCANGQFGAWSQCSAEGECARNATRACGLGGTQTCSGTCAWGNCVGQSCAGALQTIPNGSAESEGCGNCGVRSRICQNGAFTAWSNCGSEGVCAVNATQACGMGGTQTCNASCAWNGCEGQSCAGATQTIANGGTESGSCGNCGTQTRTCQNGSFTPWSTCGSQGVCGASSPPQACGANGSQTCNASTCQWNACECVGSTSQSCGACGTQTRTCSNGTWSGFGACNDPCACGPFTIRDINVVVDTRTNLSWYRWLGDGPSNSNADYPISGSVLGGIFCSRLGAGWRVPTVAELQGVRDASAPRGWNSCAFNNQFSGTSPIRYWSSEFVVAGGQSRYLAMLDLTGEIVQDGQTTAGATVRCVKSN